MSSVLIKGMKMPKNCAECPVALSGKYCRINQTYTTYRELPVRPDHCPLVEIPDHHGRLVDADAIIKEMKSMKVGGEVFITAVKYAAIVAREAPTVIEAEGDKE